MTQCSHSSPDLAGDRQNIFLRAGYIDVQLFEEHNKGWFAGLAGNIVIIRRLRGANEMYGLIVKMIVAAGKRDEVVRMLRESASDMPGCLSYVVAADSGDHDVIWVTEVWDSVASHDASLSLPSVKNAIPQVKPLISNFTKIAVTTPVWGVGLQSSGVA